MRWLAARAVPGVEEAANGLYRRALRLPSSHGLVELEPRDDHVRATFRLDGLADLAAAVHRCRRLLDLDADPGQHAAVLRKDKALRPLVAANPGLRVPGSVDGAESAIRAVLGQQVSVAAARTAAARLVAAYGAPLDEPDGSITHAFPAPEALAESSLEDVGMPRSRRATAPAARAPARRRRPRIWTVAPTAPRSTASCSRSRASARGRRRTSRCARSATRTRSRPATWACGGRPRDSGSRAARPRSRNAPSAGARGGPTRPTTSGRRTHEASASVAPDEKSSRDH